MEHKPGRPRDLGLGLLLASVTSTGGSKRCKINSTNRSFSASAPRYTAHKADLLVRQCQKLMAQIKTPESRAFGQLLAQPPRTASRLSAHRIQP
ncbi:MAG: hypothetical protein NTY19_23915, partial [Planctomycetota bacterium]|nr:hypothetical protein [Planctomycetota bacterium]